jgi:hypothetical protein
MQSHGNAHIAPAPIGWTFHRMRDQIEWLGACIAEINAARADAHAAAALYAELSRLSDAELKRRGIPRQDLHRCIFETFSIRRAASRYWAVGGR